MVGIDDGIVFGFLVDGVLGFMVGITDGRICDGKSVGFSVGAELLVGFADGWAVGFSVIGHALPVLYNKAMASTYKSPVPCIPIMRLSPCIDKERFVVIAFSVHNEKVVISASFGFDIPIGFVYNEDPEHLALNCPT